MTLFELARPSAVFSLKVFFGYWASTYKVETICVTLGSRGCAVFNEGTLQHFAGFSVNRVDTVGSGDAFAAGSLHGNDLKWTTARTATFANTLGALVASRAGATPTWTAAQCWCLIAENRSMGAQSVADRSGLDSLAEFGPARRQRSLFTNDGSLIMIYQTSMRCGQCRSVQSIWIARVSLSSGQLSLNVIGNGSD